MRRLRIAMVAPGFPLSRDEPGLAAVADLVERVAAEHDVTVFALRHPSPPGNYTMAGAKVVALGHGRAAGARGRGRVLTNGAMALVRAHRRRRLDLVHGLWADEAGAVAAVAGRLIRRPVLVSLMGGELVALPDIAYGTALGRGGRWAVKVSLRLATAVTTGSAYLRGQALQAQPRARVEIAPLGVDTDAFNPAAGDGTTRGQTVLFAGSLEPVKDAAVALRAVAELARARADLRLAVCGDGRLRDELQTAAREAGIADRTAWLGHVPRVDLPPLYRSAAVLCVTSRHEAQSMVAVEAAACGLPVVGFAVGVVPQLAGAGGGIAVPRGDERALVSALARVLDEPETRNAMGRAARAIAVESFDIDGTSRRLMQLYGSLSAPGTRRQ